MGRRRALRIALLAAALGCSLAPLVDWLRGRPCGPLAKDAATLPPAPRLAGAAFASLSRNQQTRARLEKQRQSTLPDGAEEARLTRSLANASTAPAVLEIVDESIDKFGEVQVAAAISALGKREVSVSPEVASSQVLHELVDKAEQMLQSDQFEARQVANIFWSLAVLRSKAPRLKKLLPTLIEAIDVHAPFFKAQEVSIVIWGCAKLRLPRMELHTLLPGLASRAVDKADSLAAQAVSNIIWSSATLRLDAPELLKIMPVMQEMVIERIGDMGHQEVSNILWSSAVLQDDAPELLEALPALAAAIVKFVGSMSDRHVSNCIWAIARLRDRSHVLHTLPLLMGRAEKTSQGMLPQHLGNIFWAVAVLRGVSPELAQYLPLLLEDVEKRADRFSDQELSNIVWAIGVTHLPKSKALGRVLQKLQSKGVELSADLTTQAWANMCWGLAERGCADQQFMKEAAVHVMSAAPTLPDRKAILDLPITTLAFARLGMRHRRLLDTIASRMSPLPKGLGTWQLCAMAWAYGTLDDQGRFAMFRDTLQAEIARRRVSPKKVALSRLGPDAWRKAR